MSRRISAIIPRIFGRINSELKRRGLSRFEPDLQIAAVALAHKLTLVTGNVKHYDGIPGLRVENWLINENIFDIWSSF